MWDRTSSSGEKPLRLGMINDAEIHRRSQSLLERVGLTVSSRTLVKELTVGQQQMVEIAKALSINARILIMDEPTSSLSAGESEKLFRVINDLRSGGVSIVYISHRLPRFSPVRPGHCPAGRSQCRHLTRGEITHDSLVRMMVVATSPVSIQGSLTPQVILSLRFRICDSDMAEAQPEFLAALGRDRRHRRTGRAGRTEALRAIFGSMHLLPVRSEFVSTHRKESPRDAIGAGIALVPEDRKQQGVFLEMAIRRTSAWPR